MEWKTAWSYLPINYSINISTVCNITQRTFFKNNLNGTKVKIKFSNLFSKEPIIFENVVIGKKECANTEITNVKPVTYKKNKIIEIGPGTEFYSDDINFPINDNDDIVISVYIKERTAVCSVCSTWSAKSWNTKYGLNGNFTLEQKFNETGSIDVFPALCGDPNKAEELIGITDIKVYADSDVKTIVLFGDSITHMSYFSDALTQKIYKRYPGKMTIVNRGIGGNRLLYDASRADDIIGGGVIFGESGVKRFYHDIYESDKPEFILLLEGINDFTHPYVFKHYNEIVTLKEYQDGIKQLIHIAHANGSKIFIGTVMPFRHEKTNWFEKAEIMRLKANDWIRNQKESDGIIDFDAALRKEGASEYMRDGCHLGDGLHPNTAGGMKMADAVPMEYFE